MHRRRSIQFKNVDGVNSFTNGFTLLEVVLSIAILLMSFTAIYQLVSTGTQASLKAQFKTEAFARCESRIAEIVVGQVSAVASPETAFDDDPTYSCEITMTDSVELKAPDHRNQEIPNLKQLTVIVRHRDSRDKVDTMAALSRFVCTTGDTRGNDR